MRRPSLIACSLLLVTTACAGGAKKGSGPSKAAPTPQQVFEETDDGKPGWISRGSVAVTTEEGRRLFFGVGAGSGIKNPALLRSTVDNRARNELGKVFEVYSASLMKDYMASTGEQSVENAIKTAVSVSLEGVEIRDRYIDDDGTMYALAQLDLKAAIEAIKRAKELGAARSHVTKVDVDDIFDRHSKKPPPPPPPPKVAADSPSAAPPEASAAPPPPPPTEAPPRTGSRPDWIDGSDARFPSRKYLCGVGFSTDRAIAETGGYAALSRIFVAHVVSASKDFMGAYSKTGAKSVEVQSSETLTKISTAKVFSGVRIYEVYKDSDATFYALACMERDKAARALREQISSADGRAGKALDKAKGADAAGKLGHLGKAMDAILEREALNNELRIVDASGIGVASPYSPVDVAAAFEEVQEAIKIGVEADGPYEEEFRAAFIDALTTRGYSVTDLDVTGGDDLDVLIAVKISVHSENGVGSTAGRGVADAEVVAEIKNLRAGKVIGTVRGDKHRVHRSKQTAEKYAVRALGKKIVKEVGKTIDAKMKGH